MNSTLILFAVVIAMAVGTKAVSTPTAASFPDPHDDPRCYDADGKFDPDLGDDDLDCGNFPPYEQ